MVGRLHIDSTAADPPCPKAVVFDMDGLLLDTERIALEGFLHACRVQGVRPDPNDFLRCIGTTMQRTRELFIEFRGPDFPLDAVIAAWDDYCDEHLVRRPPPLKAGAKAILQTLRRHAIPCALATSTAASHASVLLQSTGIAEFFQVRVTGDQVLKSKPDPEIYRTATSRLGVSPGQAWALEDSAHGVRAAHEAGLRVFQIPDLVPPDPATLSLGHTVLNSLHDVEVLLRRVLPAGRPAMA